MKPKLCSTFLPDDTYKGTVTLVYPELDTSSNSSLVHAIVKLNDKFDKTLPSGTSAAVDVISGKAENAVLVPVEALHKIDDGRYTLFVMENGSRRGCESWRWDSRISPTPRSNPVSKSAMW